MRQDISSGPVFGRPAMGCGVGLRTDHYDYVVRETPSMDWFEAITENFMDSGGRPFHILQKVREKYPVALHGVSLSIGSADPLSRTYLERLKALVKSIEPFIVSDHLCWAGVDGEQLHDLLPLPFTEEALRHIVSRVHHVQEFLKRPILLENISTYVTYRHSAIPEWEFLAEVARRSGCGILLDLNNIYVNSRNHGFDPKKFLDGIPGDKVGQFHLAGHTDMGDYLFDTHKGEVIDPVWELYRDALARWGRISTLIEWDEAVPPFERLAEEAAKARVFYEKSADAQEKHPAVPERRPAASVHSQEEPELADAQRWMKSLVRPAGESAPALSGTLLNPQGKASGIERMSVYAGGYVTRIAESLKDIYEAVAHVTGEAVFLSLCHGYAASAASRNYNLNLAGRDFPDYLSRRPIAGKLPFLPGLASLEWQIRQAFHAFDGAPLKPADCAAFSMEEWEGARLLFQPSVGLVSSAWPVYDVWKERKTPVKEIRIRMEGRPQKILVSRRGMQVFCELLDDSQYAVLSALLNGTPMDEACEGIEESEAVKLTGWFSAWMAAGMLAGVSTAGGKLVRA